MCFITRSLHSLVMTILCIFFVHYVYADDITSKQEPLIEAIFYTETGKHHINLEVARTYSQKTRGLMYRTSLDSNRGMVFIYDKPTQAGIWMKNTYIPLDIIFIDCNNKVVDFVTRKAHTTDISYAPVKICKIIEVNAGLNSEIALKGGNKVKFVPSL